MDVRRESGEINDTRPLVVFLYVLMRDHITPGVIEGIMKEHTGLNFKSYKFSNGWLAKHAQNLASRLTTGPVSTDKQEWVQWAIDVQNDNEGTTAITSEDLEKIWDAGYQQGRSEAPQ